MVSLNHYCIDFEHTTLTVANREGFLCEILNCFFKKTTPFSKPTYSIDELNKKKKNFSQKKIENFDIYFFQGKKARHFEKIFFLSIYDENNLKLSIEKNFHFECKYAFVKKNFIGWGVCIHIHGDICLQIKKLEINFSNDNFFFRKFFVSGDFSFKDKPKKIVMCRELKKIKLTEEKNNNSKASQWIQDGFDVFSTKI